MPEHRAVDWMGIDGKGATCRVPTYNGSGAMMGRALIE